MLKEKQRKSTEAAITLEVQRQHCPQRSQGKISSYGDTLAVTLTRGHQKRLKGDMSAVDIPREEETQKFEQQGWGRRSLEQESATLGSPHSPAITAADR